MKQPRFTKKEFDRFFPDNDSCLHKVFQIKYGNAKQCPKCNKPFRYHKLAGLRLYSCQWCGHNIAPTAKTIFHKSSTSLKDWFYAIYLFSVSKNGVSGKELERQLGVTYKTAWRMAKHIRLLFNDKQDNPFSGTVEVDATYCGGKEKNKHNGKRTQGAQGRSTKTKTPVVGALERQGNVVAKVVADTKSSTIIPFVREHINISAKVKTDEYRAYTPLFDKGYNHETVNHGARQFVKGDTHTNTIEGFWSQLKRSINGTYHHVSPKYLQSYVNEFAYRYNRRNSPIHLFHHVVERTGLPF